MLSTWGKSGGASAPVTGTPALDTNAGSQTTKQVHGVGTALCTGITTNLTPDTVLVFVAYCEAAGTPSVQNVTSANLTFTKRGGIINTAGGNARLTIELWAAPTSGTLSSEAITVNWTSNIDAACIGIQAVSTIWSATTPWDSNGALPASAFNTVSAASPAVTFSTTQNDDMLFYGVFNIAGANTDANPPATWTRLFPAGSLNNASGGNFCNGTIWYKSVSAPQSGATVNTTFAGTSSSYTAYVDAVTGDSH